MPRLVACDECHPGVLRRYLTASPLRRQGIALVLSRLDPQRPHYLADRLRTLDPEGDLNGRPPLEVVSHIMLHRRVKDIVRTLYPMPMVSQVSSANSGLTRFRSSSIVRSSISTPSRSTGYVPPSFGTSRKFLDTPFL